MGAVVFSFFTPLISFQSKITRAPIFQNLILIDSNGIESITAPVGQSVETTLDGPLVLTILYIATCLLFLSRFVRNLMSLHRKIKTSKRISWNSSCLILVDDPTVPFSFANYIFVNRSDFEAQKLEEEILHHELTHVQQKHTIDILFIELLLVFAWLNPILFLYRRAIRLNHEFLADESVVSRFDTYRYQVLLLNKTSTSVAMPMSSTFNYTLTKTRLIMMTRKTPLVLAIFKQVAVIPVAAASIFLFGERAFAQQSNADKKAVETETVKKQAPLGFPKANSIGTTTEMMNEYKSIINKYRSGAAKKWGTFRKEVTYADHARLYAIFSEMSDDQRMEQTVIFLKPSPPPKQMTFTQADLDSWKDPLTYGVWLDEKKVDNTELAKFSPADFYHASSSALMKNAINYGKHKYQLNLMTKKYYELNVAKKNTEGNMMAFLITRANGLSEYQRNN
ncbi:MAG TPA: M56 family metallopeptidase [Cyclobacteriaceae bacterium]|nr:M56 family metallopeptidase [Cyclobacteriaceae bacterium]